MTSTLKGELEALEAEFAQLQGVETRYRETHEALSAEAAPYLAKIRDNEAMFEPMKARHAELAAKIEHLRKAVG